MSLTQTVKGYWTAASFRTALNTAFTAAGLKTLAADILPVAQLLADAAEFPAMAVEVTAVTETGRHGPLHHKCDVEITCWIVCGSATESGAVTDLAEYTDVIRATAETQLQSAADYQLLTFRSADPHGHPWENAQGVPTRVGTVTFTAWVTYAEGTV